MEPHVNNFASLDTLRQYALDTIIDNYQRSFANGTAIPSKISDELFAVYQRKKGVLDEDFLKIFSLPHIGKLTKIHLRRWSIAKKNLHYISTLVTKSVRELVLNVDEIPKDFLLHLNDNAENLEVFSFNGRLFRSLFKPCMKYEDGAKVYKKWPYIINAPNLISFAIKCIFNEHKYWFGNNVYYHDECWRRKYFEDFMVKLLTYFTKLQHLEISGEPFCSVMNLRNQALFQVLQSPNFTSLIFTDAILDDSNLEALKSLTNLEHLDLSNVKVVGPNSKKKFKSLIECLPKLKSLDISETNLDASLYMDSKQIYGLQSRVNNPLEFLGLYRTRYESCEWLNIPAKKISGYANFEQLIVAAETCSGRIKVLYNWFHLLEFVGVESEKIGQALDILLELLDEMDEVLDTRLWRYFQPAMRIFLCLLERSDLQVSVKWQAIKKLLNICNRAKSSALYLKNDIVNILRHAFKSSNDINHFIRPFINIILIHVMNYDLRLALHFSRICDQNQRQLFIDQDGMVKMMESVSSKFYNCFQMKYYWETVQNLINGNSELTEKFLLKGVDLFSEYVINMGADCTSQSCHPYMRWYGPDLSAAAKLFIQIIMQFKSLSDWYLISDRFLQSLIEAFTYDCDRESPNFYLGFILAKLLSMENFCLIFGKKNYWNVKEAFRMNLQRLWILYHNSLIIEGDFIGYMIDLMQMNEIPECQAIAICGLYRVFRQRKTQRMDDRLVRKREVLRQLLKNFFTTGGVLYPMVTDLAKILLQDPLICGKLDVRDFILKLVAIDWKNYAKLEIRFCF